MKLLTKEVRFEAQEDFRPLNLSKIKTLCCHFLWIGHHWVNIRPHEVSKCLRSSNDFIQDFLFLRLKRQISDLGLPILKVFKLGTSRIARDLDAIVAYWAGVIVIFFDLATGNFETLSMVPVDKSAITMHQSEHSISHHS